MKRLLKLQGTVHTLFVTCLKGEDSLVPNSSYLASIRYKNPWTTTTAALTIQDCIELRDYLTEMIDTYG